ncbi:RNase H family protein [Pseudomonas syringae pv. actinidiae]|nr:RNase H family protein [Pseudomonas syringae pv. actinidiae]
MTWGNNKNAEESISAPSHAYGQWLYFENPIDAAEVVKPAPEHIGATVHLYTDGSCKGANDTFDKKAFAGWGCNMILEREDSKKEMHFSGGLYNCDPHTAELSAVYQGLLRIKEHCNVHIHSDSQYVISALKNLPEFIEKRTKAIDLIPVNQRSMLEKRELGRLELWARVQKQLERASIRGLTIQWIKSHQMDDGKTLEEGKTRGSIRDIQGNHTADRLSNIGVIQGIVTALQKLSELASSNPQKYEWSSEVLRKNFSVSAFARETAAVWLTENPKLLTQDIINNILDPYTSRRIENCVRKGTKLETRHPQLSQMLVSGEKPQQPQPRSSNVSTYPSA